MTRRFLFAVLLSLPGAARAAETFVFSSATLTSDSLEFLSAGRAVTARGNAVMVSSGTRLEADELKVYLSSKTLEARGNVSLTDAGITLLAREARFDGAASTGVFVNGYFEDPPYRLWARKIVRVSSELYHMEHAAITSCELDPPHYHVRMASLKYVPGKRASAVWPRLALGEDTVFGLPYARKRFGADKKPWTLTVDPGHSSYHGFSAKSILSYRLTEHGTARVYWDHFTRTGEGLGAEYTYISTTARGSIYGYDIHDRVAGGERWNTRLAHWQQLSPRLSLQLNGLAESDSSFNNLYFRDDLTRVNLQTQSNGALSYQQPYYTARLSVANNAAFDPARGRFVRTNTVLPEVAFQGSPWRVMRDTYLALSGAVRSQYDRPLAAPPALNPLITAKDRSRRTGEAAANVTRKISLNKNATLEPSAGMSGNWQSWRDAGLTRDARDLYQGRGFTGLTFRHRPRRNVDYDLSHSYRVRWAPNRLERDHASLDQGMEANQISFTGNYRDGVRSARLATGYDLRQADGETLKSPRRKVSPPALDLSWRPSALNLFSFREVYGLYPVRRPETAQFSWRLGRSRDLQFSSGFSYNGGLPGQLQLRHGAAFPLTRGWRVEGTVRYIMQGPGGLEYDSIPRERFEQEYVLRRDLHCWNARISFRRRPGFTEAYIRVDLKSTASDRRALRPPDESQYYPGREEER